MLLVEDEQVVAMDAADMLRGLGCRVIGPARSLEDAESLARESAQKLDAAVLDLNFKGTSSLALARDLSDQGVSITRPRFWTGQPPVLWEISAARGGDARRGMTFPPRHPPRHMTMPGRIVSGRSCAISNSRSLGRSLLMASDAGSGRSRTSTALRSNLRAARSTSRASTSRRPVYAQPWPGASPNLTDPKSSS